MSIDLRPTDPSTGPAVTEGLVDASEPEAARSDSSPGRCFLCDRPFRPGAGEPIAGGEGIDLCVSCGSIYVGGGCC